MTQEPLSNIIADDPYSCAVYTKKFYLLNTQGWKQLKRHARAARRQNPQEIQVQTSQGNKEVHR